MPYLPNNFFRCYSDSWSLCGECYQAQRPEVRGQRVEVRGPFMSENLSNWAVQPLTQQQFKLRKPIHNTICIFYVGYGLILLVSLLVPYNLCTELGFSSCELRQVVIVHSFSVGKFIFESYQSVRSTN